VSVWPRSEYSHAAICTRMTSIYYTGGPKSRRRTQQGFLGANKFLKPDGKLIPVTKKRVGIAGMKAPAREHADFSPTEKDFQIISSYYCWLS
jgi:hypothetical protein